MVQQNFGGANEHHTVTLDKAGKLSFGICIVSGEVKDSPNSKTTGIFIKGIVPDSPAQSCGKLKVGDRILSLNDQDVRNATEQTVVSLIKGAGQKINLKVQTFEHSGKSNNVTNNNNNSVNSNNAINNNSNTSINNNINNFEKRKSLIKKSPTNDNNTPATIKQKSIEDNANDDDDDIDTRDMTGRIYSAAGFEIDRASAGNVKLTKAEKAADKEQEDEFGYTMKKIKKRYGFLGQVTKAEVNRPPNTDLGLAISGHRDRQQMACFVAGVDPKGLMANCDIKPGDEILEVNGHVLQHKCHLNASVILKNLPGEKFVLVLYRRKQNTEGMSVKPVTKFPPMVDETEYLFSAYKNVKAFQIQKVGCLGIMVIEGKHVEVGNGIFISDIRVDSNAEKAGLKVGDLLLAVNKDVVVDANYETACSILRRSEGIVRLVIASLKSEEQIKKEKEAEEKKKQAPPEPEKPADPATAEIKSNKKTTIEIKADKKPLGVIVVGGYNNFVKTGCVVTHVYPDLVFGQDNRLQIFDQIIDINGKPIKVDEHSSLYVHRFFYLPYEKVTMNVYRCDPPEIETINIEFTKKPGKDLGLSFAHNSKGLTISAMTPSGIPEIDTKLQRGDLVKKFNGESLEGLDFAQCYAIVKGATGKITMEIQRPNPTART